MVHGCMVYTEHAETASDPCVCVRCKYTTSIDIQKRTIYIFFLKLVTHVESHASAVSLLESGE